MLQPGSVQGQPHTDRLDGPGVAQRIDAVAAAQQVRPAAAGDQVVAFAAVQRVVAQPAVQRVVGEQAVQPVIAVAAGQTVALFVAAQLVVEPGADDVLEIEQDIALGIAILTAIAGIIQTILSAALPKRRIGNIGTWVVLRSYLVFLLALIPASAAGVGLDVALGAFRGGFAVASIPTAVVSLIAIGTAMAIVYFAALALLRAPEFTALAQPIYRRLRRGIPKP